MDESSTDDRRKMGALLGVIFTASLIATSCIGAGRTTAMPATGSPPYLDPVPYGLAAAYPTLLVEDPLRNGGLVRLRRDETWGMVADSPYTRGGDERLAFSVSVPVATYYGPPNRLIAQAYVAFYGGDVVQNALTIFRYESSNGAWMVDGVVDPFEIELAIQDDAAFRRAFDGLDAVPVVVLAEEQITMGYDRTINVRAKIQVLDYFQDFGEVLAGAVDCTIISATYECRLDA